ncbi:MAG: hypothetical protein ACUVXB_08175 [Bryobacteraceae bacterium]
MKRNLATLGWLLVIGCYMGLTALAYLGRAPNEFDEYIPLVLARLIRQGLTPYVDFFSHYPPGSMYLHAASMAIVGETVLGQHFLHLVFWIGTSALFWRWARRLLGGDDLALPATLLFVAGCAPVLTATSWIGFCLGLSVLLICSKGWDQEQMPSSGRFALCGLLAGLTLVTRINFAVYAAAAVGLAVTADLPDAARKLGWRTAVGVGARRLAIFAVPMIACLGAWLLPYGRQMLVPVEQTVLFLMGMIPAHRFIELPVNPWIFYALAAPAGWFAIKLLLANRPLLEAAVPAAASGVLAGLLLWRRTDPGVYTLALVLSWSLVAALQWWRRALRPAELGVLVFYCGIVHYSLTRADDWHLIHLAPAALALAPFVFTGELMQAVPRRVSALALTAAVAVLVTWMPYRPLWPDVQKGAHLLLRGKVLERIPDAERMSRPKSAEGPWGLVYQDRDELAAVRYVRERTRPDEPVFAGVKDHSRLYINNVRLYWLLDRPVPTPYVNFEPGLVTERVVQERMIAGLESRGARWAVLQEISGGDETFRKRGYRGSTLLDEYLADKFTTVAEFGRIAVLVKR